MQIIICIIKFLNAHFIVVLLYVNDILVNGQNVNIIERVRKELFKSLNMKDLAPRQHNLGRRIVRDRKVKNYGGYKKEYVVRVLELKVQCERCHCTSLGNHFKMSKKLCSITKEGNKQMEAIP